MLQLLKKNEKQYVRQMIQLGISGTQGAFSPDILPRKLSQILRVLLMDQ